MANLLIDNVWMERSMPWFFQFRPRLMFSSKTSPMNSFFDFINTRADRLSSSLSDDNSIDYYRFYANRLPRIPPGLNSISKLVHRQYQLLNCIGKGGFGHVFDARRKSDDTLVVMKFLPRNRILNWGTVQGKRVPYEIEVLLLLRGVPGIIQIFDHYEEPDRFIFTMEKIPHSLTLFDFVMENSPLANTELLRHLFRQILHLNVTLQLYGVWHRDCKPENILYCRTDSSLHLIDFGSATTIQNKDFTEFQGTLEIMVPEWIIQKRYSGEKACVWTIGVCLYFLLFQEYPFRSKMDIVGGRSRLQHQDCVDTEAYQVMRQCLHGNEYRRPNLAQLQQLAWLN